MPAISSKITLSSAAQAANTVIADIDLIKGGTYAVANTSSLESINSNYLTDGQVMFVVDAAVFYKLTITPANPPISFVTTYAWSQVVLGAGSAISSSAQISALGFINADDTGSFLTSADTASFIVSSQTSSFILVSQTSSMSVATASYIDPTFISASAAASGFGAGGSTPDGTISGSQQIIDLGFIQSSQTSSFVFVSQTSSMSVATASYIDPTFISASAAAAGFGAGGGGSIDTSSLVRIDQTSSMSVATASYALYAISASYEIITELSSSHAVNADTASFISDTFISASAARSGFGSGGGTFDVSALNTFTGSIQTQVDSLTNATSSYLTSADTASFVLVSQTSSMNVLSALTASYVDPTFISASAAAAGFGTGGGGSTPAGTVSGSQQIADLGYINQTQTSSMSVLSASYAVTASYATTLQIGSEISGPGFSINQDGILTLSPTTDTSSAAAGSIYYDGTDFYFNL
jgi:hypothetical protein